ncbi:MAG: hypothetical protein LBS19_10030 [Clostridiales bacterium]|nr:hypothetical protein [Clostridiales bacterium]
MVNEEHFTGLDGSLPEVAEVALRWLDNAGIWHDIQFEYVSLGQLPYTMYVNTEGLPDEVTIYVYVDGVQRFNRWVHTGG